MSLNKANILELIDQDRSARLLDLGCDDGAWTCELGAVLGSSELYGVEIRPDAVRAALQRGLRDVVQADLNTELPFETGYFDVVHANQVIEHLANVDMFASEIHRVLRPGGYAIVSTENASSWCNIGASVLGWQTFSLANFSNRKGGVGNPLSIHRNQGNQGMDKLSTWCHMRILNPRGLREFFDLHGLRTERFDGAGYFPLPSRMGKLDPVHSHFMTVKVRKRHSPM